MQTVEHLIHRSSHSTVIANIPTFGPVAFVLWGYGRDGIALSLAQMILIDFQQCKTVIELFSHDILRSPSFYSVNIR